MEGSKQKEPKIYFRASQTSETWDVFTHSEFVSLFNSTVVEWNKAKTHFQKRARFVVLPEGSEDEQKLIDYKLLEWRMDRFFEFCEFFVIGEPAIIYAYSEGMEQDPKEPAAANYDIEEAIEELGYNPLRQRWGVPVCPDEEAKRIVWVKHRREIYDAAIKDSRRIEKELEKNKDYTDPRDIRRVYGSDYSDTGDINPNGDPSLYKDSPDE